MCSKIIGKKYLTNIEKLKLQKSEVESVCWLSTNEIRKLEKEGKFFRNNIDEFDRLLDWLENKKQTRNS